MHFIYLCFDILLFTVLLDSLLYCAYCRGLRPILTSLHIKRLHHQPPIGQKKNAGYYAQLLGGKYQNRFTKKSGQEFRISRQLERLVARR